MIIIIDGYNVLKQIKPGAHHRAKEQFIQILQSYAHYKQHSLILVFDGGDQPYEYPEGVGGLEIIQSGYKQSADDYIKKLLEKYKDKDILLVTSDRELRKYAQQLNIESTDSRSFWLLIRNQEKEKPTIKATGLIKKFHDVNNEELERLMEETSRKVPQKSEEQAVGRKRSGHTLSKQEKKLLKKVKKL